jgi:dihydrodipicolinate synthase/N-acetylneuraminate lyase
VIKAALHAERRIPTARVRMPLSDASPAAADQARQALAITRETQQPAA